MLYREVFLNTFDRWFHKSWLFWAKELENCIIWNCVSGSHVSGEPQYINTFMYLLYGTCAQSRGFRQYFWWMTSLKLTFLNKRTWKLHKDCQDKIWILQQHWLQQEDFTLGLDISRLHYVKTGYGVSISENTKLVKNQINNENSSFKMDIWLKLSNNEKLLCMYL